MPLFISIISTFPTVVFTILLSVAVIYWLISLSGMTGDDLGDMDGADGSVDAGGLLATLGLKGVPLPLAVTLVVLFGWLFSYFAELLVGEYVAAGLLYGLFGLVVLVLGFFVGIFITSWLIKPLRPLFKPALHLPTEQRLAGTLCTIRSGSVDRARGRADAYIDGDHLILQVRSDKPLVRGDRAILINYLADEDAYRVIPEDDFNAGSND